MIPVINHPADALRWLLNVYETKRGEVTIPEVQAVLKRGLDAASSNARKAYSPTKWGVNTVTQALELLSKSGEANGELSGPWVRSVASRASFLLAWEDRGTPESTVTATVRGNDAGAPTYQELADTLRQVMSGEARAYRPARELLARLPGAGDEPPTGAGGAGGVTSTLLPNGGFRSEW